MRYVKSAPRCSGSHKRRKRCGHLVDSEVPGSSPLDHPMPSGIQEVPPCQQPTTLQQNQSAVEVNYKY